MHCENCNFDNHVGAGYCGGCGTLLGRRCPTCGTTNPARFRYCGECGAQLPADAPLEADPRRESGLPAAERRHLTVMFCDLVGSTSLSMRVDPEELREIVRSYQSACAEAIERFDGYIAQYLGDGVLVYFGYPVALENEAERAVQAGLQVVQRVKRLNAQLRARADHELAVRVGVHTGVVVMGEVGGGARRERLALGDTPNIAARIQTVAEPNSVAISAVTYRLVARTFECEDVPGAVLRGVSGVGSVYRVVREKAHHRSTEDATFLIGREDARRQMLEAWTAARSGRGRALTIIGDAGIGKTSVLDDFLAHVRGSNHVALTCACLPYYQNTALYPFIDLIEREIDVEPGQDPAKTLEDLAAMLARDDFPIDETLPLFAALLGVPTGPGVKPLQMSPQVQREKTRAALLRLVLKAAETCPVVLLVEDLHWADPSTLEFLAGLVRAIRRERVLVVFTARAGFGGAWESDEHAARLELGRLGRSDVERLVHHFAGKPLPSPVLNEIILKTDGVPLFVEELCKMVMQSGLLEDVGDRWVLRGPLPPLAIPATLHDSLEARLDRLAAVKEIAQVGATLGREFPYALLRSVTALDETTLCHALAKLVEAEVLLVEGEPPDASYTFKHALIQEAAYQSLLRSARQRHHLRVAQVLGDEFADSAHARAELLAYHFTAAGLPAQAIPHWLQAGRRALASSAHAEAVAHLKRGLELIAELPPGRDRDRNELYLRATLGPALLALQGYTDRDVRDEFARAHRLCEQIGDDPSLGPVLTGLFAFHIVRGELAKAAELAEDVVRLAERTGDADIAMVGDLTTGIAYLTRGEPDRAAPFLEAARSRYDAVRHREVTLRYGHDIGVLADAYEGLRLWMTGRTESALERSIRSIALARQVEHPYSLAFALAQFGIQLRYRHDFARAADVADELYSLSQEWGFGHWLAEAMLLQGWVGACRGQTDAAIERANEAIAMFRRRGIEVEPYYLATQAEICQMIGHEEDALALVEQAITVTEAKAERWWWSSELFRLRGELMQARDPRAAERDLRHAIQHARTVGSTMLALRAARAADSLEDLAELVALVEPACVDRDYLEASERIAGQQRR